MAHNTFFDGELGIIQATINGTITFNDVKEIIADATHLAAEKNVIVGSLITEP